MDTTPMEVSISAEEEASLLAEAGGSYLNASLAAERELEDMVDQVAPPRGSSRPHWGERSRGVRGGPDPSGLRPCRDGWSTGVGRARGRVSYRVSTPTRGGSGSARPTGTA